MTHPECFTIYRVAFTTHLCLNWFQGIHDILELIARASVQALVTYIFCGIVVVLIRGES